MKYNSTAHTARVIDRELTLTRRQERRMKYGAAQ